MILEYQTGTKIDSSQILHNLPLPLSVSKTIEMLHGGFHEGEGGGVAGLISNSPFQI